ncbi:hypothetical protein PR003_g24043 [Phytophthora rubi]|uniref:Uncharacterized protein n=2 Tax=Phytophthora rubi TaxID=129364 RepID=A0A6A3IU99_9STRA|nr:hypothetical protein PR001_g22844 [Phytophthora rubi]KAE9295327.1 hypothetical protein PR003_g24043 [Phytophthora rubi]
MAPLGLHDGEPRLHLHHLRTAVAVVRASRLTMVLGVEAPSHGVMAEMETATTETVTARTVPAVDPVEAEDGEGGVDNATLTPDLDATHRQCTKKIVNTDEE